MKVLVETSKELNKLVKELRKFYPYDFDEVSSFLNNYGYIYCNNIKYVLTTDIQLLAFIGPENYYNS